MALFELVQQGHTYHIRVLGTQAAFLRRSFGTSASCCLSSELMLICVHVTAWYKQALSIVVQTPRATLRTGEVPSGGD